ncbi:unnamed protein product, partial [Meganyctiphanes norvegica]
LVGCSLRCRYESERLGLGSVFLAQCPRSGYWLALLARGRVCCTCSGNSIAMSWLQSAVLLQLLSVYQSGYCICHTRGPYCVILSVVPRKLHNKAIIEIRNNECFGTVEERMCIRSEEVKVARLHGYRSILALKHRPVYARTVVVYYLTAPPDA